jgi:hypothetical protein
MFPLSARGDQAVVSEAQMKRLREDQVRQFSEIVARFEIQVSLDLEMILDNHRE